MRQMLWNTRNRVILSAAVLLVALAKLDVALHWMNQPSDFKFYAGAFGVLALAAVVPLVLSLIWKQHRSDRRFPPWR